MPKASLREKLLVMPKASSRRDPFGATGKVVNHNTLTLFFFLFTFYFYLVHAQVAGPTVKNVLWTFLGTTVGKPMAADGGARMQGGPIPPPVLEQTKKISIVKSTK